MENGPVIRASQQSSERASNTYSQVEKGENEYRGFACFRVNGSRQESGRDARRRSRSHTEKGIFQPLGFFAPTDPYKVPPRGGDPSLFDAKEELGLGKSQKGSPHRSHDKLLDVNLPARLQSLKDVE